MSNQISSLTVRQLAGAKRVTASTNNAAVDISYFTGSALFILDASNTEAAGQTADIKLQHSADGSTAWADTGITFAQVTSAGTAFQQVMASVDGLRRFVRVAAVLAGTSAAVTYGVAVVGKANY